jgi:hypothetical protein
LNCFAAVQQQPCRYDSKQIRQHAYDSKKDAGGGKAAAGARRTPARRLSVVIALVKQRSRRKNPFRSSAPML